MQVELVNGDWRWSRIFKAVLKGVGFERFYVMQYNHNELHDPIMYKMYPRIKMLTIPDTDLCGVCLG